MGRVLSPVGRITILRQERCA